MNEKTSKTSGESVTSETPQLTQVFQRIYDNYQGFLEKEQKINDVKILIKAFIEAQILEERAERNITPLFDSTSGSAFVEHNEIRQFLRPQHRRELEEIGRWLEVTVREKLENAGFVVNRIDIPGIYLEIETITAEIQKEIVESHSIREYGIISKEIPDFLKDIAVILSQLGFDRLSIETIREGELYYITAFTPLIQKMSAKTSAIAQLRFGKLAIQKSQEAESRIEKYN